MRTFSPVTLDPSALAADLDALEAFLSATGRPKERAQIRPFFAARPNLCAALGLTNSVVETPDLMATELDLFGDFTCDAAAGDSETNAYTLVEFEDAELHSVFRRLATGKTMKRWSPRFEHGFSQLVDWAWRLSTEGGSSSALRRIFGQDDPTVHLLLVIGRDADLTRDDIARLRWRANHVSLGPFRMSCFTFDGIVSSLRRRLQMAAE